MAEAATAAPPVPPDPLAPPVPPPVVLESGRRLARLTVDQYHDLIAAGILGSDSRIELLDGLLVEKMPKSPLRTAVLKLILRRLGELPSDGFHLAQEAPVTLHSQDSEPEPDVAIIRGQITDYLAAHPTPTDVLLLIEVANTSLRKDLRNAARYAVAGIERYLVVDVVAETFTLHEQPTAEGYRDARTVEEVAIGVDGDVIGTLSRTDAFPNVA